jgi:hypothetical protein
MAGQRVGWVVGSEEVWCSSGLQYFVLALTSLGMTRLAASDDSLQCMTPFGVLCEFNLRVLQYYEANGVMAKIRRTCKNQPLEATLGLRLTVPGQVFGRPQNERPPLSL